jgi:hypothetical protein
MLPVRESEAAGDRSYRLSLCFYALGIIRLLVYVIVFCIIWIWILILGFGWSFHILWEWEMGNGEWDMSCLVGLATLLASWTRNSCFYDCECVNNYMHIFDSRLGLSTIADVNVNANGEEWMGC